MTSILNVHTRIDSPGGTNRFLEDTLNAVDDRNTFDLHIAASQINYSLFQFNDSIETHEFGGGSPSYPTHWINLPRIIYQLTNIIDDNSIDIVIFHSIPTHYWTTILRYLTNQPKYVWFAHSPNSYLYYPGKLADLPLGMRVAVKATKPILEIGDKKFVSSVLDGVISNSKFTSDYVKSVYSVKSDLVYPGVNTTKFRPSNNDPETEYIFSIGQLDPYKNFDVVLRSMKQISITMDDPPKLYIAGTGSHKDHLIETSIELGIDNIVEFLGYVDNNQLVDLYSNAILTIYIPKNEPFGLVPVESMACGTPVVALDSGGFRETIADQKTGVLVDKAKPHMVSNAIMEVISNNPGRMGHAARNRISENFSLAHTVNRFERTLSQYE